MAPGSASKGLKVHPGHGLLNIVGDHVERYFTKKRSGDLLRVRSELSMGAEKAREHDAGFLGAESVQNRRFAL